MTLSILRRLDDGTLLEVRCPKCEFPAFTGSMRGAGLGDEVQCAQCFLVFVVTGNSFKEIRFDVQRP
jgi:hypothetical protein